jgi:antitoxin VapB
MKNGASQTVRLPAEFRSNVDALYIRNDEATGYLVLSLRPDAKTWGRFLP